MYRYVLVLLVITFELCKSKDILEVKTTLGKIRGKLWISQNGRAFAGFTGIPYAKPPVGQLRFEAPVPLTPWEGILDASKTHEACPQISIYWENNPIIGNEDCLYLNVYTPQLNVTAKSLPVMFYMHGGSFIMGSGKDDWLGPELLLNKNIVLVTVNYRLGALGFLSTGDEVVPGNNGLKDQNFALKWVKENAAYFGGDPDKITVFGNSAGAVCAHLHMISPLSRDLINGAIIQSGSAFSSFGISSKEDSVKNSNKLGSFLNCSALSSQDLIYCLKSIDAYEIIRQEGKFVSWDKDSVLPFRPIIESDDVGAFLTELPVETIKSGKVANVPIMTGTVAQEAAYKSAALNSNPRQLQILDQFFNQIIPPTFGITSDKRNSSKRIRQFYFGEEKIDNFTKSELTDMYTDGWYTTALDQTLALHAQYSTKPIHQYFFEYRGSVTYSALFGDPTHDYGVCHTDELLYLYKLGLTFPGYVPTDSDLKMSEIMTTLWTNFAETGDPNSETNNMNLPKWSPITTEDFEYYHIRNYTDITMGKRLRAGRTEFWRSIPVGKY